MPSANDELRGLMFKWFGDYVNETGPIKFLESHGFILTPEWLWIKPSPSYTISNDEWHCLEFLVCEWDFGGILDSATDKPA